MKIGRYFLLLGAGAMLWGAIRVAHFFAEGGLSALEASDLPRSLQIFFGVALVSGVLGGFALLFRREGPAAQLLWLAFLGVLMEGGWAAGLMRMKLDLGLGELLLSLSFAVAAQVSSRFKTVRNVAPTL